ncbi:MAG: hypothetical protein JST68_11870 [Bacteroidetes bacterium]|nr:hypothetical protein [Bacteroidota bacterium]
MDVYFLARRPWAQAYTSETELRNVRQRSAAIRLPYATDPVEDALKRYMMTKGFKSTSAGGYIVYRGVSLDGSDTTLSDLYFKAASAGRKEKDMTILNMIPVKKNQDVAVPSFADSSRLEKARIFLDSLAPFVASYNTGLLLNTQQEALGKAQRKMNDLKSEQGDLEKKMRQLQSDLDQNQKDQVKSVADLKASVNADDDTKRKYQKRVNRYLDEEASLEKKRRRTQQDLEDNKHEQEKQQLEIDKQRQGLDAVKLRQ